MQREVEMYLLPKLVVKMNKWLDKVINVINPKKFQLFDYPV